MSAPAHIGADPVGALLPGRSEQELDLRRRIAMARDLAGARMVTLKGEGARSLNHLLAEAAGTWLFAPASIGRLRDQRAFLLRLATLTGHAERLEAGDE